MLQGTAAVLVRHLSVEVVASDKGKEVILATLANSHNIKELQSSRIEAAHRAFQSCQRMPQEAISSFLLRLNNA